VIHLLWILGALLGLPLFAVLSGLALTAFHAEGISSTAVIIELYRLASNPTILAIPLFTFAGVLLSAGDSPRRLVNLFRALVGWMPGGIAIVTLLVTSFFTAFTGASGVTIIALGGLLLTILQQEGYQEKFNLGLLTTTGSLGLLFPPSLPLILYGLVAGVSIDSLFRAGITPGILLIVILAAYSYFKAGRQKVKRTPFDGRAALRALKQAAWELPLPFIVVVGIYGGWVTATEAATITVVYVLLVELVILREIGWRKLLRVIEESMTLVGAILVILGGALGLTSYLVDAEVPMRLLEWLEQFIGSKILFLLLLNVFLLAVGALMDIFSAIVVIVPLLLPVAAAFGVEPIHLGIIFLVNLEIGYSTPPVGLNLFLASFRFKQPIWKLYGAALPFILLMLLALALVTWWPALSLWTVK
jgi:tripartite ATP-independent transporter DctM subunit